MTLSEWTQTHTFKEFLELLEEPKGNTMNEEINSNENAFVAVPVAKLTDEELSKLLANKPATVEADEVSEDTPTVH